LKDACNLWNVKAFGPEIDQPVQSDIPTLILSGYFDPITPPVYGEEVAKGLSNSFQYVFPAGAHGSVTSGDCQNQIFLDFINNPSTPPNAACIEEMGGPQFMTPRAIVSLPVMVKLLNLQDGTGPQAIFYFLGLLFLASALLIYPIVWLVRMFTKKPARPAVSSYTQDPTPTTDAGTEFTPTGSISPPAKPLLYRLAPWLAALAALLLLVFTIVFLGVVISLVNENDLRMLVGMPGSARPLFILPPLVALLALLMLAGAVIAWARRSGSVWGRIYLTLLSLAALICVAILGTWGMLTAFIV
jgi:hypothetical protein